MGSVYLLTVRQLAGRWRLSIMAVLGFLPVAITLMIAHAGDAPSVEDFESAVLSAILIGAITPLVVLATGTAAFANEVEDRTLANLTLAPIPRYRIVLPKLLGAITVAGPFIALSALATSYIAFNADPTAEVAVTLSALVGVSLYASVFVWLGLATTQAIGVGLLYIVLWEGFFSGFVSGVRLFSIRHYSIAFMHLLDARRFGWMETLGSLATVGVVVVVFTGFFLLTVRRLRRMDVP
jgi:ABC-2 type transport system permease protein